MKNKIPFVDLKAQYCNHRKEIDGAIASVISETAFIRGKYVSDFERDFAQVIGVDHCVSCANGTDAIYLALKLLNLGPEDEVITTANSWISTSESITNAGGRVVFVDTDSQTFNLDPEKLEEKITEKTRAILPVHLLGQPANMTKVMEIAEKYDLPVIEDCAQAHLATWEGRKVGTFGLAATFSFYPGKNLGAYGDAGGVVTNDPDAAARMRLMANHGSDPANKHNHKIEGINSRLDGLQAAILSAKLPHLPKWTERRREAAALYSKKLSSLESVTSPYIDQRASSAFHVYSILAEQRDDLQRHLSESGVMTTRHYPTPLPFLEAYQYLGYRREDFPVAALHQERMLSLPIFPEITGEQISHVVDAIEKFYQHR